MNDKKETSLSHTVDSETLTLVGVSIVLSAYAWDLSFNLGAFGVIFMPHIITIWLFSLTILLVSTVIKKQLLPIKKWWESLILCLPTLWLILKIVDDASRSGQILDRWLHGVSVLAMVISLPYMVYLFLYFTDPDIVRLKRQFIAGLVGIVLLISLIGYTLGANNYLIMSCQDFAVSGQDTPSNCVDVKK